MITRDISEASLGSAIDPNVLASMRVGGTYRGTSTDASQPGRVDLATVTQTVAKVRRIMLFVVLGVVGLCGLGLAGLVPALVHSGDSGSPAPSTIPTDIVTSINPPTSGVPAGGPTNLFTVAGWKALVAAIKSASGATSVYDVVAYPEYASVGLDGGDAVERRLYREGGWEEGFNVRTPAVGRLVELRDIDPQLVARLPDETARHFGVSDPLATYLIISAIPAEPRISVYVQSDVSSQFRSYRLDGTPLD